jgi:hypothetical protein
MANVERSHAGPTTLECNRDGLPALADATGLSRAYRRLGRRLAGGQMEKPLSLYPSPHSFLVGRGNIISGRVYPGWRSFLAYPGLLSVTPTEFQFGSLRGNESFPKFSLTRHSLRRALQPCNVWRRGAGSRCK